MSTIPILVDGAVLACVGAVVIAVGTVSVSPGSAINVISKTNKALIASDIENAVGAADSVPYTSATSGPDGKGHFEGFVVVSGATTKFYDGSKQLHLSSAGGTCDFVVDTPGPNPAPPPANLDIVGQIYPAVWTVDDHGQATVYLEASP